MTSLNDSITYLIFCFSDADYSLSVAKLDEVDVDISLRDEEATLTMVEDPYLSTEMGDSDQCQDNNVETSCPQLSATDGPAKSSNQPVRDERSQSSGNMTAPTGPPPSASASLGATNQCVENLPASSGPSKEAKDETVAGNHSDVLEALEKAFAKLTSTSDLQDLIDLHSRMRVVVSVEKLMELKGTYCSEVVSGARCGKAYQYSARHVGARVDLEWKCANGHCGKWESSEVLTTNRYSKVYLNDSLLPIAIVLSGNNFAKFALFCKVLNLSNVHKSNFCSFQTKCALPVVKDVWLKMKGLVTKILKGYKEICLCGDGRNDSPGHSARYCVYTLMEHVTKAVVDLEVIDKRETGGNSAVMEREGLRRLLERLMTELPLNELCTDASSMIIKLVRDMKGNLLFALLAKLLGLLLLRGPCLVSCILLQEYECHKFWSSCLGVKVIARFTAIKNVTPKI